MEISRDVAEDDDREWWYVYEGGIAEPAGMQPVSIIGAPPQHLVE